MKLKKLFLIPLILGISLILGSCAFSQVRSKNVEPQTVLLSQITFHGETAGLVGPAEFGDFSVSYTLGGVHPSGLLWLMEFLPTTPSNKFIFMLWVKDECPEAVALFVYSTETEITKYFIYDSSGVPRKATEDAYDAVLEMAPTCSPPKREV